MLPVIESGEMSFRIVRMMAPLGNVTLLAPDAPWNGAATNEAAPEKKPTPAPTPSRPMACRRFNRPEGESFIVVSPSKNNRKRLNFRSGTEQGYALGRRLV